jgi:hypothetical protein
MIKKRNFSPLLQEISCRFGLLPTWLALVQFGHVGVIWISCQVLGNQIMQPFTG